MNRLFSNFRKIMKKILVIGATGKIGVEMIPDLRACYGHSFVVATTIDKKGLNQSG